MEPPALDEELRGREITMEEVVRRQVISISYLRSYGLPWDEAVMELRDLVTGIEDDTFNEEWGAIKMRAIKGPEGNVFRPTPPQLSEAYRAILGLLHRKGVSWRRKRVAFLGDPKNGKGR